MFSATLILYPELQRVPPDRRPSLLSRARHQPFDWLELAGLGTAIVGVAWASRAIVAALPALPGGTLADVVVAVPLVFACAGPFYWRRTRRAIHEEIERRDRGDPR